MAIAPFWPGILGCVTVKIETERVAMKIACLVVQQE
jgi:hypothetical protein